MHDSNNFSVGNLWYMKQWYLFYPGNIWSKCG
ncbi:MAG: hypothetical protein IJQ89_10705 [Bacteroidales bacterium]|nr:hypothetical protein [Bacteroidales bacterium]